MAMNKQHRKWLVQGGIGASLIGFGLSLAIEASHWKHSEEPFWVWVGGGTLGIALLVGGIVVLIKTSRLEQN
jgi:hypothetical protein